MNRRFVAGILSLTLALAGVVGFDSHPCIVQAAEVNEAYKLEADLVDADDFYELCVGDEVFLSATLKTKDGEPVPVDKWEFVPSDVVKAACQETGVAYCYCSDYADADESINHEMLVFDSKIPESAFGKYVYQWAEAYLTSDDSVCATELVRSQNTVTSWAGSDYFTVGLNDDKNTVSVFSVWKCSKADFPSQVEVNGRKYKVTAVGNYAAEQACKDNLKSLTLPATVKKIGKEAFKGASKLKTITIKGNLTSVGKNAFADINKKAVIKIKATKKNYDNIVKKIKKSGVPKTVTFKRI